MLRIRSLKTLLALPMLLLTGAAAHAQPGPNTVVTVVVPIYHQLVSYHAPARLLGNPTQQANQASFLSESTARGETVEHWTQMLSVSGHSGSANNPGATIERATELYAEGFKRGCPETFSFKDLGRQTISGRPADAIIAGCGSVADAGGAPGATHSETALILIILGEQDLYSIQWAERGRGVPAPLPVDLAKWEERLKILEPVKLCAIVPGEKAPYPSCVH